MRESAAVLFFIFSALHRSHRKALILNRARTRQLLSRKRRFKLRPQAKQFNPPGLAIANRPSAWRKAAGRIIKIGGAGRNRTADESFADSCLTTWRRRLRTKTRAITIYSISNGSDAVRNEESLPHHHDQDRGSPLQSLWRRVYPVPIRNFSLKNKTHQPGTLAAGRKTHSGPNQKIRRSASPRQMTRQRNRRSSRRKLSSYGGNCSSQTDYRLGEVLARVSPTMATLLDCRSVILLRPTSVAERCECTASEPSTLAGTSFWRLRPTRNRK